MKKTKKKSEEMSQKKPKNIFSTGATNENAKGIQKTAPKTRIKKQQNVWQAETRKPEKSVEKSQQKPKKIHSTVARNDNAKGIRKTANRAKTKQQQSVWQPETKELSQTSSGSIRSMKAIQHSAFTILYPKEPKKVTITTLIRIKSTGQGSKCNASKKKLIPIAKVQPRKK